MCFVSLCTSASWASPQNLNQRSCLLLMAPLPNWNKLFSQGWAKSIAAQAAMHFFVFLSSPLRAQHAVSKGYLLGHISRFLILYGYEASSMCLAAPLGHTNWATTRAIESPFHNSCDCRRLPTTADDCRTIATGNLHIFTVASGRRKASPDRTYTHAPEDCGDRQFHTGFTSGNRAAVVGSRRQSSNCRGLCIYCVRKWQS